MDVYAEIGRELSVRPSVFFYASTCSLSMTSAMMLLVTLGKIMLESIHPYLFMWPAVCDSFTMAFSVYLMSIADHIEIRRVLLTGREQGKIVETERGNGHGWAYFQNRRIINSGLIEILFSNDYWCKQKDEHQANPALSISFRTSDSCFSWM